MNSDKVKPCRWCGGVGIFDTEKDAWYIEHVWLRCNKCRAYAIADTFADVVRKWNEGDVHRAIL